MAPKHKSTPSQNPLRFEASSSSSNPTPSHIRFRDEKAKSEFFENFSRRGFHSECQVILSDFSNTDLPDVLRVLRVEHPDYHGCDRLKTMSKDEFISSFCEHPSDWGER